MARTWLGRSRLVPFGALAGGIGFRRPLLLFGSVVTMLFIVLGVVGPFVVPYDPIEQNLAVRLSPPGTVLPDGRWFFLGTDQLGRDVLSRLLEGARVSLVIAFSSVAVGFVLGSALGILAGYLGRPWDDVIMRLVDLQMAFPFLFLGMLVLGLFGRSMANIVLVLAIWGWVSYARLARALTLSLRRREFIEAAQAIGADDFRILSRHVFPNIVEVLVVVASLQVGRVLIAQAGLEFLGLGIPPPAPIWGSMLSDGRTYVGQAWWISGFPGLAITLVVIGLNFFGNGLRGLTARSRF